MRGCRVTSGPISEWALLHAVYNNGSWTYNCKAVQMPPLLLLQKLPGKGDGGWKKEVFCIVFWLTRRSWVLGKKCVLGDPIARATSYCLLPDTFWLRASKNVFKVGSVKYANSLSPPSIGRKYALEVKVAKGLKRCRAKVKGVNNPTWTNPHPCVPRNRS